MPWRLELAEPAVGPECGRPIEAPLMEFAGGRTHPHLDAGERPAVLERPLPMLAAMPNQLQQQLAVHVPKAEALDIDKPRAGDLVDARHQEVGRRGGPPLGRALPPQRLARRGCSGRRPPATTGRGRRAGPVPRARSRPSPSPGHRPWAQTRSRHSNRGGRHHLALTRIRARLPL